MTDCFDPRAWALAHDWRPEHLDCTTAVMLKILDGKCKMSQEEKETIAILYDTLGGQSGPLLGESFHALIAQARRQPDPALLEQVYEQRVLAETRISRPVMKAYKALLRAEGVIGRRADPEDNPA